MNDMESLIKVFSWQMMLNFKGCYYKKVAFFKWSQLKHSPLYFKKKKIVTSYRLLMTHEYCCTGPDHWQRQKVNEGSFN